MEIGRKRPQSGQGVRGDVQGFSRASRLRMIETIQSVDRGRVGRIFFATLTVPRGEAFWAEIERHRQAWVKRFERQYPRRAFIIWKKEPHQSGTVHLHALIFWLDREPHLVREFRPWNDVAWAEVIGSANAAVVHTACNVTMLRSWTGVAAYASKYLAKSAEGKRQDTGRIWGIHNRKLIPSTVEVLEVDRAAGIKIRRTLRRLQQHQRQQWHRLDPDGRWRRIYRVSRVGHPDETIEQQVAACRANGVRIRRIRPRVLWHRSEPIWADVITDTGFAGQIRTLEKVDDQWSSFMSSLHFIKSQSMWRLVDFFTAIPDLPI